jgi:hypothetical protein
MSNTQTRTTKKRQSTSDIIYDLMRDLIQDNPKHNRKKIIAKWLDIVIDDTEMNNSALELSGRFVFNSVSSQKPPRHNKAKMVERATKRIARHISRYIFSMVMPNGKTLGKCTFGEVAKFNNGLARLVKLGKPNQIIEDTITEAQAWKAVMG